MKFSVVALCVALSTAASAQQRPGSSVNNLEQSPPIVGTQLTYCPVGSLYDYKCTFSQIAAFVGTNILPSATINQLYGGSGTPGVASVFSTLPAAAFPALTGAVTTNAGSLVTTLSAGVVASSVGSLGGDLTGTLPNPTIAAGAITAAKMSAGSAATNFGGGTAQTGILYGNGTSAATAITPGSGVAAALAQPVTGTGSIVLAANPTFTGFVTLPAGAAATNIGTLSGDLTGTLPSPTIAAGAITAAKMAAGSAATNLGGGTAQTGILYGNGTSAATAITPGSGVLGALAYGANTAGGVATYPVTTPPYVASGVPQNGLGAPGGTMASYAAGDTITLSCSGVTFTTAPVVGVTAVSGGVPTGTTVSYPGVTSSPVTTTSARCSQASTTGSGTGYAATVALAPLAAYVMPALLGAGGGSYNGNLFMNAGDLPLNYNAGSENTFLGDKAGFGLYGSSSYNTSLGHNSCGYGNGSTGVISSYNTCLGDDAGRNLTANAAFGSNTLIGYGTGRNIAGGFNTYIGSTVASSSGANNPGLVSGSSNTGIGYQVANGLTTGIGNTLVGQKTGSALVAGSGNLILSANAGAGDVCVDGDTQNEVLLCSGQGIVAKVTAGVSDPTTSILIFSGAIEAPHVSTSAGSGGVYLCVDSTGLIYKKSSCP